MAEDKHLKCLWKTDDTVCGREFTWTVKDQAFYAEKQFSAPKYCREHREMRKKQQDGPFGKVLRMSRAKEHRSSGPRIPGQESDAEMFA